MRQLSAPVVLATENAHKLAEITRILAPFGIEVEAMPGGLTLPPEDAWTYEENALGKARAVAQALGREAIADDSGIEADALDGAPGVRSARFAGSRANDADNLARLLAEAPAGSGLTYRCALAWVGADGASHVLFGASRGRLWARPRGERGFGYDPVFVPEGPAGMAPEGGVRTMAELTQAEKDAISHRGAAVRAWAAWRLETTPPLRTG